MKPALAFMHLRTAFGNALACMLRSGDIVEQSDFDAYGSRRVNVGCSTPARCNSRGGLGRFSTREFGATADIEASEAQDVRHFLT